MPVMYRELRQGAERNAVIEFLDSLRTGELIDSASAIAHERKPTDAVDLTISAPAATASTMTINDREVLAGQGILFTVEAAADQDLGRYVLHGTVTTDSTPAQIIPFCLTLDIIAC